MEKMKAINEVSELQALIMRLFPPHEYGEDSNVEELYNRCTDLEKQVEELTKVNEELKKDVVELLDKVDERMENNGVSVVRNDMSIAELSVREESRWFIRIIHDLLEKHSKK
jgi:predicted transcriptional regulator